MTTIATDGRHIAADSRVSRGWEITEGGVEKIVRFDDGWVMAVAGRGAMKHCLTEWIRAGAAPEKCPKGGPEVTWSVLAVDPDRKFWLYTHDAPYRERIGSFPFTLGSGADFARGAMLAGADVRRAIEIAAHCDCHTGGDIQVVDVQASCAALTAANEALAA